MVLRHFKKHRRDLPWRPPALALKRGVANPFAVLISEVMLQQTQVSRVKELYPVFMRRFPSPKKLARSSVAAVLKCWQGLGYNRRALYLKRAAEIICREYGGKVPRDRGALVALPSIGAATAAAILCYAWNEPEVFIETNVRTVFIHHFFPNGGKVSDAELLPLVAAARGRSDPRTWYAALMDYGTHLKSAVGNVSYRSAAYVRQSKFEGSRRELRGAILRHAAQHGTVTARDFQKGDCGFSAFEILSELTAEGFLMKKKSEFTLA